MGLVGCCIGQVAFGSDSDFYDYRFRTKKDPDDLASFYGGEEFMELFCVVPFMGTLMMRGGTFDDEGTVHTTGFPPGSDMQVSMVFSDEENPKTGKTLWFNKRERFKDVIVLSLNGEPIVCWDMIQNFGFHSLPDGTIEVYHRGEYFHGRTPPFSLIVRLVFQLHARWVAWAAEHHINHHAFTSKTAREEEEEEESRSDMPLHLLKHHVWRDVKATVFGWRDGEDPSCDHKMAECGCDASPSFLLREDKDSAAGLASKKLVDEKIKAAVPKDIAIDRKLAIAMAAIEAEGGGRKELGGPAPWELIRKTNNPEAYKKATELAVAKHATRRRNTTRKDKQ